jgi:hypothetical protein
VKTKRKIHISQGGFMSKLKSVASFILIFSQASFAGSDNSSATKCTDKLSKGYSDTMVLMRPLSAKESKTVLFHLLNTEVNRPTTKDRLAPRLLKLFQNFRRQETLTAEIKNEIYQLFLNTPYETLNAEEMTRLREYLTGDTAPLQNSIPQFYANLTFLNHGGLLNDNATWLGSDEEFRDIINILAAKNEVLVFISSQEKSMAGFTDLNIHGEKENVKQFLNVYYDRFYSYSTKSDKEQFLDKALKQR